MTAGQERERRLVFGEDPERYDRARPSYPSELIDDLVELVGTGARVIDVGCGTGKATSLLAARGMSGVGVEADAGMAGVARRNLADVAGWRVDVSDFETWVPAAADTPADLIASAQAWHWVNPEVGIHRAHDFLRPGGWIALWWNWPWVDDPSPMAAELDAIYERIVPELDFNPMTQRPMPWRRAEMLPPAAGFAESMERDYRWSITYTTEALLDVLQTHSNHRLLAPAKRQRLLGAVREMVDTKGGYFPANIVCHMWAAQRL